MESYITSKSNAYTVKSSTLSHQGLKAVSASENWRPATIALVIEAIICVYFIKMITVLCSLLFTLHLFYQWITHTHKALSWAVLSSFIISTISLLIFKAVNQAKPLRVQLTCDDVNKSCLFLLVASSSVARATLECETPEMKQHVRQIFEVEKFWEWWIKCTAFDLDTYYVCQSNQIQACSIGMMQFNVALSCSCCVGNSQQYDHLILFQTVFMMRGCLTMTLWSPSSPSSSPWPSSSSWSVPPGGSCGR